MGGGRGWGGTPPPIDVRGVLVRASLLIGVEKTLGTGETRERERERGRQPIAT